MRKTMLAAVAIIALTSAAQAGPSERTLSGAAIGAGTGALVAGPVGAVAGGVVGAVVGGPKITRSSKKCWYERDGTRHCRYR